MKPASSKQSVLRSSNLQSTADISKRLSKQIRDDGEKYASLHTMYVAGMQGFEDCSGFRALNGFDVKRRTSDITTPTRSGTLVKVTSVQEMEYRYRGHTFRLIDALKQKGNPHKWLHHFEFVTGIVYTISLSSYDEVITGCDGKKVNKLKLALNEFRELAKDNTMRRKGVLLVFTDVDEFKESLKNGKSFNVSQILDGYTEDGTRNWKHALDFVETAFEYSWPGMFETVLLNGTINDGSILAESIFQRITNIMTAYGLQASGIGFHGSHH
eukprot:CAMPEP_0167746420 /NCGR_PEP_ID=MMETSP0110_2-20121227/3703_1 /TAXON_ID=629695 /ORGANISM="Gymnochlora sp., Strain CCMP2014" /LENGTH=269 /DNA_ID=CAMNT_0007631183 /DNA_START=260 /DNA_END=1066 /DNA_ORIENTATION=-